MLRHEHEGDERARFCGRCRLHVYDLSAMTREEARALVSRREGRTCVRFFRRADGTVITKDCPVGLAAVRRRMARVGGLLVAGLLTAAGTVLATSTSSTPDSGRGLRGALVRWFPFLGGGRGGPPPGPPIPCMGLPALPTATAAPPVVAPRPVEMGDIAGAAGDAAPATDDRIPASSIPGTKARESPSDSGIPR